MKSKHENFEYIPFKLADITSLVNKREGEVKLGEVVTKESEKKYIVIGIEESVGPTANSGNTGAENAFAAFITKFLNTQSNQYLTGEDIKITGKIILSKKENTEDKYQLVNELDSFVQDVLIQNLTENQIPIIVGGGHNNCYPLIKYISESKKTALNVVNLDPHADYRPLEGRHSGNGFSYAHKMSYLNKYHVFGLHQSYNSQEMLTRMLVDGHSFSTFEDYLDNKINFQTDFDEVCAAEMDHPLGLELDLDSIIDMPTSARTPSGISVERARIYIRTFARNPQIAYLHLPEGAPTTSVESLTVGKTLSYLVTDFIKSHKSTTD